MGDKNWVTFPTSAVMPVYSACVHGFARLGMTNVSSHFLPGNLAAVAHDVIGMVAPTGSGTVIVALALRRCDLKDNSIDVQVFGFLYNPHSPSAVSSGSWIQHHAHTAMPGAFRSLLLGGVKPCSIALPSDPPSSSGLRSDLQGTIYETALSKLERMLLLRM